MHKIIDGCHTYPPGFQPAMRHCRVRTTKGVTFFSRDRQARLDEY